MSPQARLAARYGRRRRGSGRDCGTGSLPGGMRWYRSSTKVRSARVLRSRGAQPTAEDSTGLLLQLFVVEGLAGFKRVDGQFALAIWDSLERSYISAGISSGVIPYITRLTRTVMAFASEIRALLTPAAVGRAYDLAGVSNYLTYLTVPGPGTLFNGVCKLAPGHVAELDADRQADAASILGPCGARDPGTWTTPTTT